MTKLAIHKKTARNQLLIDGGAIQANIRAFRARLGDETAFMAILKANGYGVGSDLLAPLLGRTGVDQIGLQEVQEATKVRATGCALPILLLSYLEEEVEEVVRGKYSIAVNDPYLIDCLQQEAKKQGCTVAVHLAIDSGLNRIGCKPEEAVEIARQITAASHLELCGLMSHFSSADCKEQDEWTLEQASRLFSVRSTLADEGISPYWCHLANTAGASRFTWRDCNMARIGIGIYGLAPSQAVREAIDLVPALSLESRLVEIRQCKAGDAVSYGSTYRLKRDGLIGVVPIGYGDGIHMHHSNQGVVWIGGKKLPIVGLICMDFLMVDLSSLPSAQVGDRVVLFGKELPPHEVAERVDTTVHQLITCIGARVERRLLPPIVEVS